MEPTIRAKSETTPKLTAAPFRTKLFKAINCRPIRRLGYPSGRAELFGIGGTLRFGRQMQYELRRHIQARLDLEEIGGSQPEEQKEVFAWVHSLPAGCRQSAASHLSNERYSKGREHSCSNETSSLTRLAQKIDENPEPYSKTLFPVRSNDFRY